jgi:RNA polymerase sigma-70 factor (ECF subfamily)
MLAEGRTEAELVRRIRAGEPGALDDLYRHYLTPLYGYMVMALHDHHAAEDAAHEVFVRVLKALPAYEERGIPFRVWLFRIARNHLIDVIARRPATEDATEQDVLIEHLDAAAVEQSGDTVGTLDDDEFLRLIQILPLGQRQVLILRYVFDMSFDAIALALGMRPGAARNQQHRAFAALRPRLLARDRGTGSGSKLGMSRHVQPLPVVTRRRRALAQPARG